jgi:hypothetical protein
MREDRSLLKVLEGAVCQEKQEVVRGKEGQSMIAV